MPFLFLQLPPEIRDIIYDHASAPPLAVKKSLAAKLGLHVFVKHAARSNLLLACCQIANEYNSHTTTRPTLVLVDTTDYIGLNFLLPPSLQYITRLEIYFPLVDRAGPHTKIPHRNRADCRLPMEMSTQANFIERLTGQMLNLSIVIIQIMVDLGAWKQECLESVLENQHILTGLPNLKKLDFVLRKRLDILRAASFHGYFDLTLAETAKDKVLTLVEGTVKRVNEVGEKAGRTEVHMEDGYPGGERQRW